MLSEDFKFKLRISQIVAVYWCALMSVAALFGCNHLNKTKAVSDAEKADANAVAIYAHNSSSQYDALETADIKGHTLRMDVELAQDMNSLATQAKLDGVKWNSITIAAETTRLQAVHDQKIADYAASLAHFRTLKTTNEQVNLGAHLKIAAALNPPATVSSTTTVDLSGQINAASGVSAPGPIVPTK